MTGSARALLTGLALLLGALPMRASHLDGYVFTFETPPDSYTWSHTTTITSLDGERRLGAFETETVTLSGMDYLGGSTSFPRTAYLGFDIILAGPWSGTPGDDHFIVVANGQTVLDETFSNIAGNSQSYPVDGSSARTGSQTVPVSLVVNGNTINGNGFKYSFATQFTLGVPRCCNDVGVSFRGTGAYWLLDNVVVSSTPIPEPHTALLVAGGLLALGARRRAQDVC